MTLDISASLRTALRDDATIAALLDQWNGEPSIHTRVPVPSDVEGRHIVLPQPASVSDMDGLTARRPVLVRDILMYGDKPDHDRDVDELGYLVRAKFHRQKWAIQPGGFHVINIEAFGPVAAPVDDESKVGRMVSLTIWLREN